MCNNLIILEYNFIVKDTYKLGVAGEKACPSGYIEIIKREICIQAAYALDLPINFQYGDGNGLCNYGRIKNAINPEKMFIQISTNGGAKWVCEKLQGNVLFLLMYEGNKYRQTAKDCRIYNIICICLVCTKDSDCTETQLCAISRERRFKGKQLCTGKYYIYTVTLSFH